AASWFLRTEEQRQLDLRLELGLARLLALEADAVDGGDRHFLQHRADEAAQRAVLAAHRQRHAVRDQAGGRDFQPVVALLELKAGGARDAVDALDLRGQGFERREARMQFGQRIGRVRDRLDGHTGAGRGRGARSELVLRRAQGREVERRAEKQHADAEHAGEAELLHEALHRMLRNEACAANRTGRCGSSCATSWVTRWISESPFAPARPRRYLNIAPASRASALTRSTCCCASGCTCSSATSGVAESSSARISIAHGSASWRTAARATLSSASFAFAGGATRGCGAAAAGTFSSAVTVSR